MENLTVETRLILIGICIIIALLVAQRTKRPKWFQSWIWDQQGKCYHCGGELLRGKSEDQVMCKNCNKKQ